MEMTETKCSQPIRLNCGPQDEKKETKASLENPAGEEPELQQMKKEPEPIQIKEENIFF